MKRFSAALTAFATLLLISGCGNSLNLGSSAPPPSDLQILAGDSSVKVVWTMAPGVQYWLLYAPAASISANNPAAPDNWTTIPGAMSVIDAASPLIVGNLINTQMYSFIMDARVNGGPAGATTASITVTPRLAGAIWTPGNNLGSTNILGVSYGSTVGVAVGANGAIFTSTDGISWIAQASPTPSVNLNAVVYSGNYVAVGTAGTILLSGDTVNWSQEVSATGNDLYGVTFGGGLYIATGAHGTILTSGDGGTWITIATGTTNALYAAAYGNGRYVAVGAHGVMLTSIDGSNWQAVNSGTTLDLRGGAYGTILATPTANAFTGFVAVGASGTMVASPDGVTWTAERPITPNDLKAVDFGRQFVAVGNSGTILTSLDGANWLPQPSGTTNNLNAVAHNLYGYFAVGAAGTNLSSF